MEYRYRETVDKLIDYIMKMCLWQFHSRSWDRERQNREILGMAFSLLAGEEPALDTPEARCYYADAEILRRGFAALVPSLAGAAKEELSELMAEVKDRLDHLTINGSLNQELTDVKY